MKSKPKKEPVAHITPYLLYKDVGKALDWLKKTFGFSEYGDRYTGPDGTVLHAAMQHTDGSIFMLGCPGPKYKNPKKIGSITQLLYVNVDDVDKHFAKAKKAGAKITHKLEDTFYGDRRYGATDLEGHEWSFAKHIRNVSAAEMKAAMKKL